ncbi:MAG TPA: hypothetical protein PLW68_13615 [Casimicrobiaceae bacterium]|nr:hypothetical protein [Casimicrobiaceae bacterium]
MSLAGMGVVAIWHDLLPETRDEFYEWHNREHMPERVGISGFRRGRRYVALSGGPEFFNLYEADSAETLGGQDYLNRLNAPTPWTQRVMPSFRNIARSICRVAFTGGPGSGGVMLTLRFDVADAQRADTLAALTQRILPPLTYRSGVSGVHLCLADESLSRVETAEKKTHEEAIRVPSWVIMIEGISVAGVRSAGDSLTSEMAARQAGAVDLAIYRHEYTRLKTPWSAG